MENLIVKRAFTLDDVNAIGAVPDDAFFELNKIKGIENQKNNPRALDSVGSQALRLVYYMDNYFLTPGTDQKIAKLAAICARSLKGQIERRVKTADNSAQELIMSTVDQQLKYIKTPDYARAFREAFFTELCNCFDFVSGPPSLIMPYPLEDLLKKEHAHEERSITIRPQHLSSIFAQSFGEILLKPKSPLELRLLECALGAKLDLFSTNKEAQKLVQSLQRILEDDVGMVVWLPARSLKLSRSAEDLVPSDSVFPSPTRERSFLMVVTGKKIYDREWEALQDDTFKFRLSYSYLKSSGDHRIARHENGTEIHVGMFRSKQACIMKLTEMERGSFDSFSAELLHANGSYVYTYGIDKYLRRSTVLDALDYFVAHVNDQYYVLPIFNALVAYALCQDCSDDELEKIKIGFKNCSRFFKQRT